MVMVMIMIKVMVMAMVMDMDDHAAINKQLHLIKFFFHTPTIHISSISFIFLYPKSEKK